MDEYECCASSPSTPPKSLVGRGPRADRKGKDADLAIIDGHPFDYLSQVVYTIIDAGAVIPKPSPNSTCSRPFSAGKRSGCFFLSGCGVVLQAVAYPGDNQADSGTGWSPIFSDITSFYISAGVDGMQVSISAGPRATQELAEALGRLAGPGGGSGVKRSPSGRTCFVQGLPGVGRVTGVVT